MNKYYVGAKHIGSAIKQGGNATCTRPTFDAAVEEAKRMIREENLECLVIVKIIAVVRKDYPPITVEEV